LVSTQGKGNRYANAEAVDKTGVLFLAKGCGPENLADSGRTFRCGAAARFDPPGLLGVPEAEDLARRLSSGREGSGALIMRGIEFSAAGLVLLFGVGLLFGYLAAERVTCF
jgi:hypothetical protein